MRPVHDYILLKDGNFVTLNKKTQKPEVLASVSDLNTTRNIFAHNPVEDPYADNQPSMAGGSQNGGNGNGGTSTVVIEHHRDLIPGQEWQQCPACYGSGQCPYVKCGGSGWYYIGDKATTCSMCHGSGKCTTCAGKGGQYVTVYR